MIGVDQINLHFVLSGWQPGDVDGIEITCVRPPPGQIIDAYMQMSDPRRYLEGTSPKHG